MKCDFPGCLIGDPWQCEDLGVSRRQISVRARVHFICPTGLSFLDFTEVPAPHGYRTRVRNNKRRDLRTTRTVGVACKRYGEAESRPWPRPKPENCGSADQEQEKSDGAEPAIGRWLLQVLYLRDVRVVPITFWSRSSEGLE
jgi:hypothetical protein